MQVEVHDRLELSTAVSMGRHSSWEKVPDLQQEYHPVVRRIRFLVEKHLM
jgi:hypothetical protein